jgi:hypothetical protein
MLRSRFAPVLGVFVLLGAPVPASAGPIDWAYTATIGPINPPAAPYAWFGTENRTSVDPATGREIQTPYVILGLVDQFTRGIGSGSATVGAGAIGPSDLVAAPASDMWAATRPELFGLTVTLTDTGSGQTRSLFYRVDGHSSGFFTTGSGVVSLQIFSGPPADPFVLGNTVFTVAPVVRGSESGEHIDLQVTAAPAAATPEPGTMILAGLGLVSVGGVRLRRRTRAGRRDGAAGCE